MVQFLFKHGAIINNISTKSDTQPIKQKTNIMKTSDYSFDLDLVDLR